MPRGDLFIVSAPSGAGKTTLIHHLFEDGLVAADERLAFSVSYTTRAPRPGEVDGREYHFVDRPAFEAMARAGGFLEWAEVYGNLYGTAIDEVAPRLQAGVDVLLDIDVQGAEQVMARHPEACSVFIVPPDFEVLRERLARRGLDGPEQVARRLALSRSELERYDRYEYVIVNDDARRAGRVLAAIVLGRRHRLGRMRHRALEVLESFKAAPTRG